jgi:hypothetical protein
MSGYPSPNVGAGVEFAIVLSGTGVVAGAGEGEYALKAAFQSTVVVTATVVDEFGTPLGGHQPVCATCIKAVEQKASGVETSEQFKDWKDRRTMRLPHTLPVIASLKEEEL